MTPLLPALLVFAAIGQATTDTIPKELVAVLMNGMRGEPFDLRVGPAPTGFPVDVLPPRTRVVLSAVSVSGATVVGEAPGLASDRRSGFVEALTRSGWTSLMPTQRGFVSGPLATSSSVCRGQDFVTLSFVDRAAGGTYVRAIWSNDPRRQCQTLGAGSGSAFFADVRLPTLTPPAGVRASGATSGANNDSWTAATRLQGDMSPAAIVAHYTQQVTAIGWRVLGPPVTTDGASIVRFSVPSTANDTVVAMLVVTPFAKTGITDVFLRVVRAGSSSAGFSMGIRRIGG